MSRQFVKVGTDGAIHAFIIQDDAPEGADGDVYREVLPLMAVFPPWPPTPTSVLQWVDGTLVWHESATLAEVIAAAVDEIDGAAESARAAVLTKKATKAEEYTQAEEQARGWRAAEYAGKAPPDVTSWAAAKWRDEMSDRQAAESIIAQADAYRTLLSGIRALRLLHMENARHAADSDQARAEVSAFRTALSSLMMF